MRDELRTIREPVTPTAYSVRAYHHTPSSASAISPVRHAALPLNNPRPLPLHRHGKFSQWLDCWQHSPTQYHSVDAYAARVSSLVIAKM